MPPASQTVAAATIHKLEQAKKDANGRRGSEPDECAVTDVPPRSELIVFRMYERNDLGQPVMRSRLVSVFVALLAFAMGFSSVAARAETWSVVVPMAEPRAEQTATLLPDGEVLVAGGYNGVEHGGGTTTNPLTLAQLFDPSTRSWVQAAPTRVARDGAKAALLGYGSVLVVGGTCPFLQYDPETKEWVCDSSTTAEAYDPSSNTWNPVAAPSELQRVETLTALPDGRVLLVGLFGPRSGDTTVGSAVYDPDANAWSIVAKPLAQRADATATLMNNGDILLAGGFYDERVLESVEEYDPETTEWTILAPMHQPRMYQAATLLPDGSVFVAGGEGSVEPGVSTFAPKDVLTSAEAYNPATNAWQEIGPMNMGRTLQTATALPDGDVLMVGGQECNPEISEACLGYGDPEHPASGNCCAASSAEVYEASSGRWTFTEPITSGMLHTETLLQNGEVLVTGGELPLGSVELSSAYVYGPAQVSPPPSRPSQLVPPAVPPTPKLIHLSQSHRTWRETRTGSDARRRHATPVGTVFAFVLSESANVRLKFTQLLPGKRVGEKCLAPRPRAITHLSCSLKRSRGLLEIAAHAGGNRIAFHGSLPHGSLLPTGRYSVSVVADTATSHSPAQTLDFTIVR